MKTFAAADISKLKLDCCLLVEGEKPKYKAFPNDPSGYRAFHAWATKHSSGEIHFCMEATGCYHLGLATFLAENEDVVSVENPRRIKHLAIAVNLKNKNDKVDSFCIAKYAQMLSPREWVLKAAHCRELDAMRTRLKQLREDVRRETNRLENTFLPEFVKCQIEAHIAFLESQILQVEKCVREVMASSEQATKIYNAVIQLKGAGPEIALLMASLDVTKFESSKAVPVFFGLNPRQHQSGKNAGKTTISKAGDAAGRTLLVCAATSGGRHNPALKDMRDRLRARGLKPKQANAAAARKLLMIAWGIAYATVKGKPVFYPGGTHLSRGAHKYCAKT